MAIGYEVPVRLQLNDAQFTAAAKKAEAGLEMLRKEYEDVVEAQTELIGTDGKLTKGMKEQFDQVVKHRVAWDKLAPEVAKASKEYLRLQEQIRSLEKAEKDLSAIQGRSNTQNARLARASMLLDEYRQSLRRVGAEVATNIEANERLGTTAQRTGKQMQQGFKEAGKEGVWLTGIINDVSFKLFVLTFAGKQVFDTLLNSFVKVGESVLLFEQRVKSLTGSTEAIKPLYGVVDRLGIRIDDASQAFTRFAVANQTMKRTNQELVTMTETVLAFGLAAGGTTQEVSAGLQQLGQGLASNTLQGDELRSVMENLPLLAKALADQLAGGSVAALRAMGSEGQLTGEKVSGALLAAHKRAVELAEALPDTTEKAANRVENAWSRMIAEMLKAAGGTSGVTTMFNNMAKGFDDFGKTVERNAEFVKDALGALGATFITVFSGIILQQTVMVGQAVVAMVTKLVADMRTAQLSLASFAGALNPGVAVAAGVLVGGLTLLLSMMRDTRLEAEAATGDFDAWAASIEKAGIATLRVANDELTLAIRAQREELETNAAKYVEMQQTEERGRNATKAGLEEERLRRNELAKEIENGGEKLAELNERQELVNERIEEFESAAQGAVGEVKDLTDSSDEYLKVLERLNPALKEQNDYMRDRKTLADAITPDNYQTIIPAIDALDESHRRLASSQETVAKSQDLITSGYSKMLDPKFDKTLKERIDLMIAQEGVQARITSAYRTFAEQQKLYAKYLAGGPLAAKPGTSAHETGKALDIVAEGNKKITKAMAERYGLEVLLYENSNHVHLSLAKTASETAKTTKATTELTEAQKEADKAQRLLNSTLEKTINGRVDKYNEELASLNAAAKAAGTSTEDLAAAQQTLFLAMQKDVEQMGRANPLYIQRLANQKEQADALAKVGKEAAKASKEAVTFEKLWTGAIEEIGKDIQNELADAFESLFNGTEANAQDFLDNLKKIFTRSLAQIAAAVVQQNIVIPIMAQVIPGASGVYGTGAGTQAQSMFGGQSGGNSMYGLGTQGASNWLSSAGTATGNWIQNSTQWGTGGVQSYSSGMSTPVPGATKMYTSGSGVNWGNVGTGVATLGAGMVGGYAGGQVSKSWFGDSQEASTGSSLGASGGAIAGAQAGTAIMPGVGTVIGAAIGAFIGAIGGGGIGSRFAGSDRAPNVNGYINYKGEFEGGAFNGMNQGTVYAATQSFNTALQELEQALGGERYGVAQARHSYQGEYQHMMSGADFESWMKSRAEEMAMSMTDAYVSGIKNEARQSATGEALAGLLEDAFAAAGDDVQALEPAVEWANQAYAELQQAAGQLFGTASGEMLGLIGDVATDADALYAASKRSGMAIGDMLIAFDAVAAAVDAMGYSADFFMWWDSSLAASVGKDLVTAAGGMDAFAAGYQTFYNEFLSDVERDARELQSAKDLITRALGDDALTTYSTRDAYKGALGGESGLATATDREITGQLIALSGAFDLVFDAAEAAADASGDLAVAIDGLTDEQRNTINAFLADIAPDPSGVASFELLRDTMRAWGDEIPGSAEALWEMAQAGAFTDEQLLRLANHSDELGAAFGYLADNAAAAEEELRQSAEALRLAAEEQAATIRAFVDSLKPAADGAASWRLLSSVMQEWIGVVPMSTSALYSLIQAGALTDEQLLRLANRSDEVSAAFAWLEQSQAAAQAAMEESMRNSINAQYNLRTSALNAELDAVRDYVSGLQSILSALEGAMEQFGAVSQDVISMDFERARRQLGGMAAGSGIPSADSVDAMLGGLTNGGGVYASSRAADLANARIRADLGIVADRVSDQITYQEWHRTYLEQQADMLADWRDRQLESINGTASADISPRDAALSSQAPEVAGKATAEQQVTETAALRTEVRTLQTQQVVVLRSLEKIFKKWDGDGLPPRRDEDGSISYVLQAG